jgi:hypothetical protein
MIYDTQNLERLYSECYVIIVMLSVILLSVLTSECNFHECHYA